MRLLTQHISQTKRCLLVSPGKSSDHVLGCLGWGHVAVINRAALLVPGPIDYAFCNDLEALEQIKPTWDRISRFVIPDRLGIDGKVSMQSWGQVVGAPHDRALIFPHLPVVASEPQVVSACADPDRLAVCNSACVGLHALGRLGYQQVWVIGCDGGESYSSLLAHGGYGTNFSTIQHRMWLIAAQIKEHHGTDVRFWPEAFE